MLLLLFCNIHQVSAKLRCPRRNERRGGKNLRPNGQSAKLLKVPSNWVHANLTDGDDKRGLRVETEREKQL